jgi:Tol biopolymer transport system component
VLNIMTVSKLRTLGAAALACGFAWGGVHSSGQLVGQPGGSREPAGAPTHAGDPRDAVTRSVDRLQSELDESARRNAEMQKTLQDLRAELKARPAGPQSSPATKAVMRLAAALKRHPARLSEDPGWGYQIYMLDLIEGGTTLIVDEPIPGHLCSGRAQWSHDGSRIVFETAGGDWPRARLFAIEARDGRPSFTELGDGNNPRFSPDDRRIAFALHAGNEAGAGGGVWMMNADGSGRHRAADFGAPFWSPDGRELLVNNYAIRPRSTVINLATEEESAVAVPGHRIFSWPGWAGPGMLVSALAPMEKYEGTSIVLLDVRSPGKATIIDVLWRRSQGPDVDPRWVVYRPDTRECFFVGVEPTQRMIYVVKRGEPLRARPLGVIEPTPPRQHQQLAGLSFSPDGRYLLFDASRIAQK